MESWHITTFFYKYRKRAFTIRTLIDSEFIIMNMIDSLVLIQQNGCIEPKPESGRNCKYSNEFKNRAVALIGELGGRNKAAKALGIAPSLITSFRKQKDEGRF